MLYGHDLHFEFQSFKAKTNYILPTIEFNLRRFSTQRQNEVATIYTIINASLKICVKGESEDHFINSQATPDWLQDKWQANENSPLTFYLTLDNFTLSQIEKIRKGGDLQLDISLKFQAFTSNDFTSLQPHQYTIPVIIAKSQWVDILSSLNYKNIAMIELPKLEYKGLSKAIDMLNDAWKSYSTGDMDDVLVKCRKALQIVGNHVKKSGFEKQEEIEGEKRIYPDWKKFFESDSKNEVVKNISQKMMKFLSPGAHPGSISESNHGYFALLQIFSLTHLVISRFKVLDDR